MKNNSITYVTKHCSLKVLNIFTAVILFAFALNANAEWDLNNDSSTLNFVSIKKGTVGEVHHFKNLSGGIDKSGNVSITIDLTSVETAIPLRNERMQNLLFETKLFPKAEISGKVDPRQYQSLKPGQAHTVNTDITVSLHGSDKKLNTDITVIKLENGSLKVLSPTPIIVNAKDFNLAKGVNALRDIVKLPSISMAVPVSFNLVFNNS